MGQLELIVTSVNRDDAQTSCLGVLDGEVAKTTTGTDDCDCLAWSEVGSLDGLPDGDTCAEEGSGSLEGESVGDGGDMAGKGDGVLLEGSMLGEAWWVGGWKK